LASGAEAQGRRHTDVMLMPANSSVNSKTLLGRLASLDAGKKVPCANNLA
jgi:hypothetical protein